LARRRSLEEEEDERRHRLVLLLARTCAPASALRVLNSSTTRPTCSVRAARAVVAVPHRPPPASLDRPGLSPSPTRDLHRPSLLQPAHGRLQHRQQPVPLSPGPASEVSPRSPRPRRQQLMRRSTRPPSPRGPAWHCAVRVRMCCRPSRAPAPPRRAVLTFVLVPAALAPSSPLPQPHPSPARPPLRSRPAVRSARCRPSPRAHPRPRRQRSSSSSSSSSPRSTSTSTPSTRRPRPPRRRPRRAHPRSLRPSRAPAEPAP